MCCDQSQRLPLTAQTQGWDRWKIPSSPARGPLSKWKVPQAPQRETGDGRQWFA